MRLIYRLRQLARKGIIYWLIVASLILVGIYLRERLAQQEIWVNPSYQVFQYFQRFNPHPIYPKRTILLMIGDEEYWKGELARRVPINRTYLANLLRVLDSANPSVIAFDFDLRSPVVDGSIIEHPSYQEETKEFLNTVKLVSHNRTVVLTRTVMLDNDEDYLLESTIFDGYDFQGGDVREGYITLPYDVRQIPLSLTMKNGAKIDSFAGAIVHTVDEKALERLGDQDELPFGSFINAEDFVQLASSHVLNSDVSTLKSELGHKIVIVGGKWHSRAFERGDQIDTYLTPVGHIPGAFIHANYVEALLDSRTYRPTGEVIDKVIELILALSVAITFALEIRALLKIFVAFGLFLILMLLGYFFWQNLGMFCDLFIPVLLITGHFIIEQIREWRIGARRYHMEKVKTRGG